MSLLNYYYQTLVVAPIFSFPISLVFSSVCPVIKAWHTWLAQRPNFERF
jgi:hypothetical protein